MNKIKPVVYILGIGGGVLFIVLLIREGAAQVGAAIARAGWGLLAITSYHLLQTLSDAAGWSVLIPKEHRDKGTKTSYRVVVYGLIEYPVGC